MASGNTSTKYSTQNVQNQVFDEIAGLSRVSLFPANAQRIIDTPDSATTYIGISASGTTTSSVNWFLERVVVSGTQTTIQHSAGSWDSRASLSYT